MEEQGRGREMNKHLKKLKRIKIFDWFLMFFGRGKIGFKFLEDKEHYTIKFLKEGIVDFHETVEGKEKRYPRAGKMNLKKIVEAREILAKEFPKLLKEINISDANFENFDVMICPTKEMVRRAIGPIEVKKREITIRKDKFFDMFRFVPMKNLQHYDFQVAFFGDEGQEQVLYRVDGRYFLITLDDLERLLKRLTESLDIQGFEYPSTSPD